jgi:hypothetical protein
MFLGKVFNRLKGNSFQRLSGLHHLCGDAEGLQIERKTFLFASPDEPVVQLLGIFAGKLYMLVFGQFQDGLDPESTVKMIMQFHFGNLLDDFLGYHAPIIQHLCTMTQILKQTNNGSGMQKGLKHGSTLYKMQKT